jgi:hypothetical protein
MGVYIYTPRTEVKEMIGGEKVARLSYAYKDFCPDRAPASWLRSAKSKESFGQKAADKHNANGVKLLASGDKFAVGNPVFRVKNDKMRGDYNDCDYNGMEVVGELAKRGRKWYIKYKEAPKAEVESEFSDDMFKV